MRALSFLIAASALAAFPAQAQELNRGTQRLELSGDAGAGCVAGVARAGQQSNATFQSDGPSSGSVVIPILVDPTTATARGSTIALLLPVVCNTSHNITVRSFNGGLLRDGAGGNRSTGGFSQVQDYSVAVGWQAQSMRIGGINTTASLNSARPAKGDLTVDIVVPRGTVPLVAGTYRDAVVVEIRPAN